MVIWTWRWRLIFWLTTIAQTPRLTSFIKKISAAVDHDNGFLFGMGVGEDFWNCNFNVEASVNVSGAKLREAANHKTIRLDVRSAAMNCAAVKCKPVG